MIRYTITPSNPHAHLFTVSMQVDAPAPEGQRLRMPAWIPGSYMIRDFAKNIVRIEASSRGKPVRLTKEDKDTWRAAPCKGPLEVNIEVYAWDLSVRTAHLDATHGFFNGSSMFLEALGHTDSPIEVTLRPPPDVADWRVATALPRSKGTSAHGFGRYQAANYDELIDHPVEMGRFTLATFTARGVPHEVAITGRHDCDLKRLTDDLKRICEHQINFFHGPTQKPPFTRYVFMVMAVGDGYGGLEHRASTALIAKRDDLPHAGMEGASEGYRNFLGLCSHEYFHTWNVKRIKPAAFTPYALARETHSPQLWFFEGFTSYYDDLVLVRTGRITREQYFNTLCKTLDNVQRGSGRTKQSLADSSFDAWTKYYRQDENAPNAIVSYYAKGSLVALALDLTIRQQTAGKRSLDDVMRTLWREHGATGIGLEDGEIESIAELVTGCNLKDFFAKTVYSTEDAPLKALFKGIGLELSTSRGSPSIGAKTSADAAGVKLAQVWDGGTAQAAGLSAGDVIVALNGLQVSNSHFEARIKRIGVGKQAKVHAFRRDELMEHTLTIGQAEWGEHKLAGAAKTTLAQRKAVTAWLLA
jgi:predicted metalloprotease with PDZ domain